MGTSHYINIRIEKTTGEWDVSFTDINGQPVTNPPQIQNITADEASKALLIDKKIIHLDRALWFTHLPDGATSLQG